MTPSNPNPPSGLVGRSNVPCGVTTMLTCNTSFLDAQECLRAVGEVQCGGKYLDWAATIHPLEGEWQGVAARSAIQLLGAAGMAGANLQRAIRELAEGASGCGCRERTACEAQSPMRAAAGGDTRIGELSDVPCRKEPHLYNNLVRWI